MKFELKVNNHTICAQVHGDLENPTIIYAHGGPGMNCSSKITQSIDLEKYSLVTFDQRGCGESKPTGLLEENTTTELVEDIEDIRKAIDKDQIIIYGNSWGATLALCYAISYPERIRGILLQSMFLGSKEEIDWIYRGAALKHPDLFNKLFPIFSFEKNSLFFSHYLNRFLDGDIDQAGNWFEWEVFLSAGQLVPEWNRHMIKSEETLNCAKIQAHYYLNNCFLPHKYILKNIKKISHIPMVINHGKNDELCLPSIARKVCKKHKNCELRMIDMRHFPVGIKNKKKVAREGLEALENLIYNNPQ